jgi:hypothetical protein
LLKDLYDGAEVACYDQLRITKRNFHDLCAILRAICGLSDSVYVMVEEKVAMFLLVVGHGLKMSCCDANTRGLCGLLVHIFLRC